MIDYPSAGSLNATVVKKAHQLSMHHTTPHHFYCIDLSNYSTNGVLRRGKRVRQKSICCAAAVV
jgi:hypothetical protein